MDVKRFFEMVAAALACDRARAEAVSAVVLQELRAQLTVHEVADVAAQMPPALCRIWMEGATPAGPARRLRAAELIGRVRQRAVLPDDAEAERAVRAVFAALRTLLGSPSGLGGEAWDVFSELPKDLKQLWLPEHDESVRP